MNDENIIESVIDDRIKCLEEMTDVQCGDGTWNFSSYDHGMANGMIFSLSIMTGKQPQFLEAPEKWLSTEDVEPKCTEISNRFSNIKKQALKILFIGPKLGNFYKYGISLGELVQNTSERSKKYVKSCIPRLFRSYPEKGLWIYKVKGGERWSKGINTVRFQLLGKGIKTRGILGREIKLSCTCDAWKFLGADYNALAGGYSEKQFSDGRPPRIRDPKRKFKICKHIAACVPIFKDTPIPDAYK